MKLNFSWKSFLITQLPMLLISFLMVSLFLIFPPPSPEAWGHPDTAFRRIILPYVGLFYTLMYILFFLYQVLKPKGIHLDFKNHKVFYGKKTIHITRVKRIVICKKKLQNGVSISFEDLGVILAIPPWYKARSIKETTMKLRAYCASNNNKFKILRLDLEE